MKPIDRRKFFTSLHRGCKARGLVVTEDPDAGGGSHGSLIFEGTQGGKAVRIVLVYAREVSAGVQRAMLNYVRQQAELRSDPKDRQVAEAVRDLLAECLR